METIRHHGTCNDGNPQSQQCIYQTLCDYWSTQPHISCIVRCESLKKHSNSRSRATMPQEFWSPPNRRCPTRQEASHTSKSDHTARCTLKQQVIFSSTWQSHNAELIPSAFLSASASTFNYLFKVLFIFPSWYLYTIGFEFIFSLNWNLPTDLHSNPEECDS